MTNKHLSRLLARLVAESEVVDDWRGADRRFKAVAEGIPCEALLRASMFAREGGARVAGEIDFELRIRPSPSPLHVGASQSAAIVYRADSVHRGGLLCPVRSL
ncbi:MAG: hypothetical protein ACO1PB_04735 [Ramlibacter sp.]